jgi:hypothetical protein
VKGLENLVQGLEEELDIEVGVLAAVPIGFVWVVIFKPCP